MALQNPTPPVRQKSGAKWILNGILLLGIIVAAGMFAWAEYQRRTAESELAEARQQLEEADGLTQGGGVDMGREVLAQLRTHMVVPEHPEPTVATIVDVEELRQTNDFYNKAENGHYLIVTEDRAILYDFQRNLVIDVVPVVFNEEGQQDPETAPATGIEVEETEDPGAAEEPSEEQIEP